MNRHWVVFAALTILLGAVATTWIWDRDIRSRLPAPAAMASLRPSSLRSTSTPVAQPPGDGAAGRPATRPSTATPAPPALRTFTVIGAGDVLLHDALWYQAQRDARAEGKSGYDFAPLFASLRSAVSGADLAICHMETPYGPPNGPFSNYPLFAVPPQVAPALAQLGYDTCSTASNHSLDQGAAGVTRTLNTLDAAGIRHAGTARSATEAATTNLIRVKGVTVAQLSYSFGFNGLSVPRSQPWLANQLNTEAVLAAAHRAKRAGADVVIVSIHWGTEYQHGPNGQQLSVARRLLASPDIDLILGHHAHVVQPLERIGSKWVAYGMGNEVAWQNFSQDTRDGIMPRFTFTEVRRGVFTVTKAEVLPIHMWLDSRPARVYDISSVLASPTAPRTLVASCRASLRRTLAIINRRGALADGLLVVGA